MTLSACVIGVAAFLSGGVAAIFVMLVIGIHKADHAQRLSAAPGTALEAFTRSVLGGSYDRGCLADDPGRHESC